MTLTDTLFGATFGLPLAGGQARKGDRWTMRFLAVAAPTTLEEGNQVFEDIRRTLGIGCPPAYSVSAAQGTVDDTTAYVSATAVDDVFRAQFGRTPMPTDLFVTVGGLTDGWTAARQVNGGALRPVTLKQGVADTNIDLNPGAVELLVGHPVVCDSREVRIVTWWTGKALEVYAQTPTRKEIACTLRTNSAFKGLPAATERITVPAGGYEELTWPGA